MISLASYQPVEPEQLKHPNTLSDAILKDLVVFLLDPSHPLFEKTIFVLCAFAITSRFKIERIFVPGWIQVYFSHRS